MSSHPVQWLSILLLFPVYMLVSQIVFSCKIFDKDLWMYSSFPPGKPHVLSSHPCLYYPVTLRKRDQIVKLVWLFFIFVTSALSVHILFIIILSTFVKLCMAGILFGKICYQLMKVIVMCFLWTNWWLVTVRRKH